MPFTNINSQPSQVTPLSQGPNKLSLLDNTNVSLSSLKEEQRRKRLLKQERMGIVRFQSQYAATRTMRLCNRVPITSGPDTSSEVSMIKVGGKDAYFGNMMTCKSFWCPNCSEFHKRPMRTKARVGINNAMKEGYDIKMVTFTIPREFGNDDFKYKFDAMNSTFRDLNDRLRTNLKRRGVKLYTLKGLDATIDTERYDPLHLHIHSLIITNRKVKNLDDWLWRTYKRLQNKKGIHVSKRAFDISDIYADKDIHDYIVKTLGTIEHELSSTNKDGRGNGKSKGWFKWVKSIAHEPTSKDIAIYRHFLSAAKSKRTFDFSRNWDDLLQLNANHDDLDENINVNDTIGSSVENDDLDENIQNNKKIFISWSLCRQLWEAIKYLKCELFVLRVVDDYYDLEHTRITKYRYQILNKLVNDRIYDLFGDELREYYCVALESLLLLK